MLRAIALTGRDPMNNIDVNVNRLVGRSRKIAAAGRVR
jgi:hypothetical protein